MSDKNRFEVQFDECEHEGDLEEYVNDLQESGAEIIDHNINYDAECGYVTIEVSDTKDFISKFKQTNSFDFAGFRKC